MTEKQQKKIDAERILRAMETLQERSSKKDISEVLKKTEMPDAVDIFESMVSDPDLFDMAVGTQANVCIAYGLDPDKLNENANRACTIAIAAMMLAYKDTILKRYGIEE